MENDMETEMETGIVGFIGRILRLYIGIICSMAFKTIGFHGGLRDLGFRFKRFRV